MLGSGHRLPIREMLHQTLEHSHRLRPIRRGAYCQDPTQRCTLTGRTTILPCPMKQVLILARLMNFPWPPGCACPLGVALRYLALLWIRASMGTASVFILPAICVLSKAASEILCRHYIRTMASGIILPP